MADAHSLSEREWLTVSGHGAFASGNVGGGLSRRYHGLLIATLAPPTQRRLLLGAVDETVTVDGESFSLASHSYDDGTVHPDGCERVADFTPYPVPTWTFALPGEIRIVRRVFFERGRNTVYVTWTLTGASEATLTLAPQVADRDYHHLQRRWDDAPETSEPDEAGWRVRLFHDGCTVRMRVPNARWERARWWNANLTLEWERRRGFDHVEDLFCPAIATATLRADEPVVFVATIEPEDPSPWRTPYLEAIRRSEELAADAGDAAGALLRRTADAFVVETSRRVSVLAGYPWFTDWGRDTFLSLPGLLLTTRRFDLARRVLLDYASVIRNGRIPNRFPDHGGEPEYNNADATLWYLRACRLTHAAAPDPAFLHALHKPIAAIVEAHLAGTVGDGIGSDEHRLLRCGGSHTNLTWMDAKVDGRPVTPRDGKPVEINALWIDALEFAAETLRRPALKAAAATARVAFHNAFVRPDGLGLFDRIAPDGSADHAIRPNQVLAAAVLDTRLDEAAARAVFKVATDRLLTPYGLRTLDPADPDFRGRYEGDGGARDSAYHQGTVWPWLIGAYVELGRRVGGPDFDAARVLAPLETNLGAAGIGGVSEVFDATEPQRPEGCPWQAWSVAELLRVRAPRA